MNDNAKSWIAALRSGEYKQGEGALQQEGKFCCLGVACELATKAGIVRQAEAPLTRVVYEAIENPLDRHDNFLPQAVKRWLGFHSFPNLQSLPEAELAQMNDSGRGFWHIADFIEANQRRLFHE